jgi:hypothetical protein
MLITLSMFFFLFVTLGINEISKVKNESKQIIITGVNLKGNLLLINAFYFISFKFLINQPYNK